MGQGGIPPWLGKAEIRRCSLPQSNVPEYLIDKRTHHESTGQKEAMKYLRENCHHHIKCSAANSLAALIWK